MSIPPSEMAPAMLRDYLTREGIEHAIIDNANADELREMLKLVLRAVAPHRGLVDLIAPEPHWPVCSLCNRPAPAHGIYFKVAPPDAVEADFPGFPAMKGWYCVEVPAVTQARNADIDAADEDD